MSLPEDDPNESVTISGADFAMLKDELESLRQQLSESILREHVLRDAQEHYREIAKATNRYVTATPPQDNAMMAIIAELSLDNGRKAEQALSTPTISDLVVCKDEPIYQVFEPYEQIGWIEVNEETYNDPSYKDNKRIVYEKSEL